MFHFFTCGWIDKEIKNRGDKKPNKVKMGLSRKTNVSK